MLKCTASGAIPQEAARVRLASSSESTMGEPLPVRTGP